MKPGRPDGEKPFLKRCDLSLCEAMCCYEGVYLKPGEEERINQMVREHRDFFAFLPTQFVVDGSWQDKMVGRKTAVRPHAYRNPGFPAHFNRTRCVFAFADGRCSFQVLAEQLGEHPWARKPKVCWMHPLHESPSGLQAPPVDPRHDPDRADERHPGFVTSTECGKHREDGEPWRNVLSAELEYHGQAEATRRFAGFVKSP